MTSTTATTGITEVATILVPVNDQDRALAFYVEKLGFEERMDYRYGDSRWIEVAPSPEAKTTIALAPGGDSLKPGVDTGIRLATNDAAGDHERLKAAGVKVDELLNLGGGVPPMFSFSDAEGNRLVIVEQPPRR